jgi:hypothetical protein
MKRRIKNKSLLHFDLLGEACPIADAVTQVGNLIFQAKERLPLSLDSLFR